MWIGVKRRFDSFIANLNYTDVQENEGSRHALGVINVLNKYYYGSADINNTAFFAGSWLKKTKIRPTGDIDLYFKLPISVYHRYQIRAGNKQSSLLQEVKSLLLPAYPSTDIRGDGPVVAINFKSQNVELIPVFELTSGAYFLCNTRNGGSYITADPAAEYNIISSVDSECANNLIPLIKMMKCWKRNCNVPLKSFYIELIAVEFLRQYKYRKETAFYYDWMVRDFLVFLYNKADKCVVVPGTGELISLGDNWQSQVVTAYYRAEKACEYEYLDMIKLASEQWQLIFGNQIQMEVVWTNDLKGLLMNA